MAVASLSPLPSAPLDTLKRVLRSLMALVVVVVRSVSLATDLVPYGDRTAGRIGSLWRRV